MIIEHIQKGVAFNTIKIGEVFDWDGGIMMKTQEERYINTVDLKTGNLYGLTDDAIVTKISAKLIID